MSVEVAVVGAGLIGSATARHLARRGRSVALVGPAFGDTSRVFSSHHDQGRVCRTIDRTPTWTSINRASLDGIEALEREVGFAVRRPTGCLFASIDPDHPWFAAAPELEIDAAVAQGWPYRCPHAVRYGLEGPPAGALVVPELLRAQHTALSRLGGIRHPTPLSTHAREGRGHRLTLADGASLTARAVVFCVGAYVGAWVHPPLDVVLETETTLLVPVDPAMEARFAEVPTLLSDCEGPGWRGPYVVPPLRFPDGRSYLKIGCDLDSDQRFSTVDEVQRWFVEGDSEVQRPVLVEVVNAMVPGLSTSGAVTKRCILTRTPHRHPMIGEIAPGSFVGIGGHGWGAMASDGIGELVARTVLGEPWPHDVPPETCAVRWREGGAA